MNHEPDHLVLAEDPMNIDLIYLPKYFHIVNYFIS
jgi:hypothetical protein